MTVYLFIFEEVLMRTKEWLFFRIGPLRILEKSICNAIIFMCVLNIRLS